MKNTLALLVLILSVASCTQSVSPGDCFERLDFDPKANFGMTWTVDDVINDTVHYSIYAQISGPDGKGIKTSVGYGDEPKKTASTKKFLSVVKDLKMKKVDCK